MTRKLTILALDAVVPLDLAIATQLMGYPVAPYDVTVCGLRPGPVTTTSGFSATVSYGLRALAAADTVRQASSTAGGRLLTGATPASSPRHSRP